MEFRQSCVLVVDDDPQNCSEVSSQLIEMGYEVVQAFDGQQAFAALIEQDFDAVITDVHMPESDGLELLNNIRLRDPSKPLVVMMSNFGEIKLEDAYDAGAEAVFYKPVDTEAIDSLIRRALSPMDERLQNEIRRRSHERLEARLDIELKHSDFSKAVKSHSLNIGRGGMFLVFEDPQPKMGDILSFKIDLGSGKKKRILEGTCAVRWLRSQKQGDLPPGVGVEFVEISPESIPSLMELINSIKTRSYIPKG